MAEAESNNPLINEECVICTELLKNPRVLKCKHVYCLTCLENLERNRLIKCPMCTLETSIPTGMGVRHLPKHVAGVIRGARPELVTSWKVEHYCDLTVDEEAQVIYLGTYRTDRPVEMYSYTGENLGYIAGGQDIALSRIAMDSRRGLVIVSGRDANAQCSELLLYDNMGMQVGRIKSSKFKCLGRVCYHRNMDKYLVTDTDAHAIFMIDPETNAISKTIPSKACRTLKRGRSVTQNALICGSSVKRVHTWALNDEEQSMVHLYDRDGCLVRTYGSSGGGYRQFDNVWGMCMDGEGRVLVCDSQNHRLVRLTPDASSNRQEWQVLINTEDLGLKNPSYVYVIQDKLLVLVATKTEPSGKQTGSISIFSGYQ